jgi:hypothetical protein
VGIQIATPGPVVTATLRTRESVTQLAPDRLSAFRAAMSEFIARHDNRGYQFFAGRHGVPDQICKHHEPLFLPWHRGYLYHVELALQDIDPDVTLPWWNWMDEPGIPDAYAAETVGTEDNVLFSAPVLPLFPGREDWWPGFTHREVWVPAPRGRARCRRRWPSTARGLWIHPVTASSTSAAGDSTTTSTAGSAVRWAILTGRPSIRSFGRITQWSIGCGAFGSSTVRAPIHPAT